jgi:aspartate oxidase
MTSTSPTGAAPHGAAAPAPAAAGGETDVDVLVVGAGQAGLALGWQPAPAAALVRARRRGTRGGTRVAQPLGLAAAVHPRGSALLGFVKDDAAWLAQQLAAQAAARDAEQVKTAPA